ncbi:MAG TPA: ATP-binding cassette domain-containing protein [Gemmatimonadales bacterium]|nr:ATP-binding cassette domain-containing protein [Gemmatimonadales bacterium]
MSGPVLELVGLHHTFFPGTPSEQRALEGVDLTVEPGGFVVVIGINGSGKSTLLNAIAGTVTLDRGMVRLAGRDVTHWPEHRRAALIGRVFQNPFSGTAPHLTVAENLAVASLRGRWRGLRGWRMRSTRRTQLAARLADMGLGLEDRLDTPMGVLSGGQRQALTLVMATIVRPTLLLLDEHTAALDPRSAEQVLRLTEEIVVRDGLTTLMVTHSMHQAVRLGDRLLVVHRGRIVEDLSGARKRRIRVEDLLDRFDRLRNADMLDESAAEMLRRTYV